MDTGAQMEFVPERLQRRDRALRHHRQGRQGHRREGQAHHRASHIRELRADRHRSFISVPEDFLVGRVARAQHGRRRTPARSSPRPTTSSPRTLLKKLRAAGIKEIQYLYTNELDQGAYISPDAAHRRDRRPAGRARGHLPHDAPRRAADRGRGRGAVPPPVLQPRTRYDLSRVGRMKFNAPRRPRRARRRR
ncbi:MAG: hypothetical protein MZW92_67040 [Comamonadaceae bacterium]|nr:hypothetical protein [Comamonadaceae bacterium]